MDPKSRKPTQLKIKADDTTAKGRFCNLTQIGSTHDAISMDFVFAQGAQGFLLSRILMSPAHAKRFHDALGETIKRHEEHFGPIQPPPMLQ